MAIPKCTDLIEKTRERVDLLKFYYLRDALDRALYEDDAFRVDESVTCGQRGGNSNKEPSKNNKDSLARWLATEEGVSLFIIEMHSSMKVNYQGENQKRTKDGQSMCGLLYSEGFWAEAFKSAGFGAVADIVKARANGDNFTAYPGDYYVEKDKTTGWNRTYPKTPIFNSKVLNSDKSVCGNVNLDCGQSRYSMKARWTGGNEKSHSLEVFLARDGSNKPLKSRFGTCFSTQPCD